MIITHNGTILTNDGVVLNNITTSPSFPNTYSLEFDGVDDYVLIENGNFDATNGLTLSFWVKYDGVGAGTNWLFSNGGSGGVNSQFNTRFTADGRWFNYLAGSSVYTGINGLNDGNWHHLTQVIDYQNSIMYFYKDGSKSTTTRSSGYSEVDWNTISTPFYPFKGQVDEVALIGRVLIQSEITSISSTPTDLTSLNPLAWYRMGDNGAYKDPQWLIPSNENKDKASNYSIEFDGVDDYVDLGSDDSLDIFGGDFTISLWAKWGNQSSNSNGLVNFGGSTNKALVSLGFVTEYGKISFGIGNSTSLNVLYDMGSGYNDNQWHSIICKITSGVRAVYVDGIDITNVSAGNIFVEDNNTIGARSVGGQNRHFNGSIDEVSVYDKALTSEEISNISTAPTDLTPLNPIAWYKLGENATYKSPQWLIPADENKDKVSNYSMYFDGLDDSINIGNISSLQSTSNFSISFWMKRDITTLSARNVMGFWVSGTNVIQFYQGTTVVRFRVDGGYVNNTTSIVQPNWNHFTLVYDGSLTGNINRAKIYFNGVDETVNEGGTVPAVTNVGGPDFEIGTVGGIVTTHANANLDEVAFFDYSLTPTEVLSIYNGGGTATPGDLTSLSPTNYYKMGEEATFVYGANPDGTWTIPDEVGTNDGTSNNVMSDSARVGDAPNSTNNGLSSNMTIEDRIGESPNTTNNALSFNMDLIDRVEDTPPTP
jgi:hypothetical protein